MEENKDLLSTEETENDIETEKKQDTLSALLFDDEGEDAGGSAAEDTDFDAFMAEYRSLISQTLSPQGDEAVKTDGEEKSVERSEEPVAFVPRKEPKKKKQKKPMPEKQEEPIAASEWNEDITLEPAEYDDPYAEDKEDEEIIEEIEAEPDFDLGEESDNKFQLSIDFDGKHSDQADEEEDKARKYDPDKPRAMDWVFDIAEMFVFVLAAVLLLTAFVFKHSVVEGASMNNTLSDGDHLIISDLFYTPERGDIVVFEDYSTILKKAVVKRVIALPGETVQVVRNADGRSVTVYVNGEALEEEYAYYAPSGHLDECGPITLGDDEVFVMGDNRLNSTDSCDAGVGPIKIDSILGKVLFRFFPFDSFGTVN